MTRLIIVRQWRGNGEGKLRVETELQRDMKRRIRPFNVHQPLGTSETKTKIVRKDAPTQTLFVKVIRGEATSVKSLKA